MVKLKRDKNGKPIKDGQGRSIWGFDIRVSQGPGLPKRRVRMYEFPSREAAEQVVNKLREIERAEKYGLVLPASRPKLIDLIREKLALITRQNERTRETRVLLDWLSMMDESVPAGSRDPDTIVSNFCVEDVDTPKITAYARRRAQDGLCPSSVHRELTIIAATLHCADKVFPELEQWRPPRVLYPKNANSRREVVIGQDDSARLVKYLLRPQEEGEHPVAHAARIRVGHIVLFALMSACRHGEIVKLLWTDIRWEEGRILIQQTKTSKYKQIPITEPMAKVLAARKSANEKDPSKFVFTKGGNIYPKFYQILRRACEACDIPYGLKTPNGIVLHTARHTVTTRLVTEGHDFDTIGSVTGHTAKTLIAHYMHHTPQSLQRAAGTLARLGNIGQDVDTEDDK